MSAPFQTDYPNAIDNTTSLPLATDTVTEVKADVVNGLRSAILALEQELGIKPSQTFGTVDAKLKSIDSILTQVTKTFFLDPDYLTSNLGFKTILGSGHDLNLIPDGNNVKITGKDLILTGQLFNDVNNLILNGLTGLSLKTNNVERLSISNTNITIKSNVTLNTDNNGNINLPNNVNSRFLIENVNVSVNVTAANLNTLTAGKSSLADSLHTHSNTLSVLSFAGESINKGAPVGVEDNGGLNVFKSYSSAGTNRKNVIGFAKEDAAINNNVIAATSGIVNIPDLIWEVVPTAANIGDVVYLSNNPGKVLIGVPLFPTYKIGLIINNTGAIDSTEILIQIEQT